MSPFGSTPWQGPCPQLVVFTPPLLLLRLSGALRRSLPNLTRAPSTPGVPIPPHPGSAPRCLHSSRSFDWSAGLPPRRPTSEIRPQLSLVPRSPACPRVLTFDPSPVLLQTRIPSWSSRLSKATAHVSPTLKGSWSSAPSDPRSNSPRPPASAGSAPRLWASQAARRSGLRHFVERNAGRTDLNFDLSSLQLLDTSEDLVGAEVPPRHQPEGLWVLTRSDRTGSRLRAKAAGPHADHARLPMRPFGFQGFLIYIFDKSVLAAHGVVLLFFFFFFKLFNCFLCTNLMIK